MKIVQITRSLANNRTEKFIVELSNELANYHEFFIYFSKKIRIG